jgi:protein-disulfide isomerase
MHAKAPAAHTATEAAHRQGKFWEMHDAIFADQKNLDNDTFRAHAAQIGLDMERFNRDLVAADIYERVDTDAKEAAALGLTGTPGFFVNGKFLAGAKPFEEFKALIDKELAK